MAPKSAYTLTTGELNVSKSIGSLLLAFLAITAAAIPARADLFNYTGSLQTFTVSTTGVYTIASAGAQGGQGEDESGGLGAVVTGEVLLTAGTVLDIVVGQEGGSGFLAGAAGGGGGSLVYEPLALQPLEAAGGGGGGGFAGVNGSDALPGTSGGNGQGSNGGAGGISGGGGAGGDFIRKGVGSNNGVGGAGWTGNGGKEANGFNGGGGQTGPSWAGGAGANSGDGDGGYGGGGGGSNSAGGGGGGYSGGGGADGLADFAGGGGGSYIDPSFFSTAPISITETGDGLVTITPDFVATPEPGSMLLLGSVFIGLGLAQRRRARTR
jgi:hypothetical protein